MIKKILIVCGIIFIALVVIGLLGSIVLVSLSGARQKAIYPAPLSVETGIPSPLSLFEKGRGEVAEEKGVSEAGTDRLVIKTGTLNMVVKDIDGTIKNITQYAEDKKGWVVSSSIIERETIPSGSITVRVPAEIFDEAVAYFRGLAEKVTHESTQGQDVTEEYIDLQSRLRNLEATETQLLKIMERSGTITEILSVQEELTNIRGQIESLKGRIQYLEQSAKMATISVNLALSEELLPIPPSEKWRPVYVIKRAWHSVLASLRGISYLLIWIVIYSLIWIPLAVIVWKVRKIWKKKKEERAI